MDEKTTINSNVELANQIVKNNVWLSMGAGFIPFPLVDTAAVTVIQIKLLNELSKLYAIPFSANRVKSLVAALLGGLSADALTRSTLTSWIKSIPLIGIVGAFSMPIYSGAATYAVGKVFIQHFESGGTFLDFQPEKVKEYFSKFFAEGKKEFSKAQPAPAAAKA